jgi:hypothetical protein
MELLNRAKRLATPIEETDLSIRTKNVLLERGLDTISQLLRLSYVAQRRFAPAPG